MRFNLVKVTPSGKLVDNITKRAAADWSPRLGRAENHGAAYIPLLTPM